MKTVIRFFLSTIILLSWINLALAQAPPQLVPGWNGTVIIDCDSAANWSVEADNGSSGTITTVTGFIDSAIQLNWSAGTGAWVQARYDFPRPADLSIYDIFGLSIRGSAGNAHMVSLMFADTNGVFYGLDCDGISNVPLWMKNLSFPKKLFRYFWGPGRTIDWSHIDRFFVVVKNLSNDSGRLAIDHLQVDRAADWGRQADFDTVLANPTAKAKAVQYILARQNENTGLFVSWKEEPLPHSWLYDQALALRVLTRETNWMSAAPVNPMAMKAKKLSDFITSKQKADGHWPRCWNTETGEELADDQWIGDQAWWTFALALYGKISGDTAARSSALRGADWLAAKIGTGGRINASTEGTIDTWWAMIATEHIDEADSIENYLLTQVWDPELLYWWRGKNDDGSPDPVIAMDCQTWGSEFAKWPRLLRPELAKAALSFARRTLVTTSADGMYSGFDGMGPVGMWCEGTAQYISAGGQESQPFLDILLALQRPDGGMPGSPDSVSSVFGWLTRWTGLAPTAWLYFALSQTPYAEPTGVRDESDWIPNDFRLYQNYPNPFNPGTTIEYSIPQKGYVSLDIFNTLGQKVALLVSEQKNAGSYRVEWDASGFSSGVYYYRLQAGGFVESKKLIVLR